MNPNTILEIMPSLKIPSNKIKESNLDNQNQVKNFYQNDLRVNIYFYCQYIFFYYIY